ncbi:hypothetical protein L0F63_006118 [Massospora cicadina]|nr:hypothetical protein L0F63_006118 [Massospora cicadina]
MGLLGGIGLIVFGLADGFEVLLQRMTLEEKLGQMTMVALGRLFSTNLTLDPYKVDFYVRHCKVGALLSDPYYGTDRASPTSEEWVSLINQVQAAYQDTRLKIPMIYGMDSRRGSIPAHQLALAASFNRSLVREVAKVAAKDTRAVGAHWNYSPNLDVGDPFLVAEMGAEMIKGYQGTSLSSNATVAATMKHFIGYSASRSGKDQDGAWLSDRILNEYFRPPFQRGIRAGAASAMTSYSDLNGVPVIGSKKYLVELLRKAMGFQGPLTTDFGQIGVQVNNRVASSLKEALRKAISLGTIDFNMGFNADAIPLLKELVECGAINETTIDASVRRILRLKEKLGLLNSTGQVKVDEMRRAGIGSTEDVNLAIRAARESVILLQNRILPLSPSAKVVVTGPAANSLRHLSGGWSYHWSAAPDDRYFKGRGTTVLQGLRNLGSQVTFAEESVALSQIEAHDALVVCIGEASYVESEGNVGDMDLPKSQRDLLDALIERSPKPVIVVLTLGRPRVTSPRVREAGAVLASFYAGPYAGQAIAEIIYGITNPSAKLPITYANHPNDNHLSYHRQVNEVYRDVNWEFGHGLSYTTFQYSNLTLTNGTLTPNANITATVYVTNTGTVPGAEGVLFYITDECRSITPEAKRLRQFQKVDLRPNHTAAVTFEISLHDLAFYNAENIRVTEAGNFTLQVGNHGPKTRFTLKLPEGEEVFPVAERHG